MRVPKQELYTLALALLTQHYLNCVSEDDENTTLHSQELSTVSQETTMTDLSTTNLQQLLDQATKGPWSADDIADCECCTDITAPAAKICTADMDDAPLIAASPDITRELLRMRQELIDLRDEAIYTAKMYPNRFNAQHVFKALEDTVNEILGDYQD